MLTPSGPASLAGFFLDSYSLAAPAASPVTNGRTVICHKSLVSDAAFGGGGELQTRQDKTRQDKTK